MFSLQPPRHISTLPKATIQGMSPKWRDGPRLCEKSPGCYDSFFESAGGSDG